VPHACALALLAERSDVRCCGAGAFRIPIACTALTVPAGAEPSEPRPAARVRRAIRFLGASSRNCSLPYDYERLLRLLRLQRVFTAIIYMHQLSTTTSIEVTL
jgi:hypothetical protein